MRYRWLLAATLVLLVPSGIAAQTPALNNTATLKVGDVAALILNDLLRVRQDFNEPTLVVYEPNPGFIAVQIWGNSGSIERAKALVSGRWEFIQAAHIPYITERFGIQMNEQSYQIAYYQRTTSGDSKLVLRFVGGQYIVSP